jgi:hypothetical protein
VGKNEDCIITNCYSTTNVSGNDLVGGLVGINSASRITNCYSTGRVSGNDYVGGLVGNGGTVKNSFWNTESSGQTTSDGGTGKTTAEMQMASTFIAWGCEPVWTIDEGKDYPRLWWENKPGEPITLPSYGGGSGTQADPYLIYTADHLNMIALVPCHLEKHFRLMTDIDLAGFTGTSFNIIRGFTGVFDGNGHTISNFSYTSTDKGDIGLFSLLSDVDAEIKNLGLMDPNVDAGTGNDVGSLVGRIYDGTITNCYVEGGSVSGDDHVGGLVGNNDGRIINCCSTADVSGDERVGGLVGYGKTITNCYSTGNVIGNKYVGGLVGDNRGTISNCYSTSNISGNINVGGLIGWNSLGGTISNCYATGSVSGQYYIGGLVGLNDRGTIIGCYSTGSISGTTDVGGLVGGDSGHVVTSYWDIETSGQADSAAGEGKTTDQMQDPNVYIGWGCGSVWTIDVGKDYPRLWWENMPGEIITNPSYWQGSGTGTSPYLIYTAGQLNTIGLIPCGWDKHFKLMADIDLSDFTETSFNIIVRFTGTFDGNGHKIYHFTYDSNGVNYIGIFGYVDDPNAKIKNLGLIEPNLNAGHYVGPLVGRLEVGTISNCYVEGGSVLGDRDVGGLVGCNYYATITNCYSTGTITGTLWHVGGLVGNNFHGTNTNCYSTASVAGEYCVGGLAGRNHYGAITNCYSTGSVSGNKYVGGLVGWNGRHQSWVGTISNCYSTSSVAGTEWHVGGLVGVNSGTDSNSFWDIETSGQSTSDGGTGLPTDQMQMQITFTDAGWDFVGETANGTEDIWFIPKGDYPHLWWEEMQVPMKLTPRTLNCRSYGNWVKAHLVLPDGFTVEDVDSDRPAVLHSFGFESAPLYVFINKDKLVEIEATFEREAVCSLAGDWPQALTVAGFLTDGSIFLGTSTVKIIHPGLKVIEELAWYWLNGDCVHPDFCNQIDMNRDSLVNLLDYALLMNIEVEFVTDE